MPFSIVQLRDVLQRGGAILIIFHMKHYETQYVLFRHYSFLVIFVYYSSHALACA